MKVNKSELLKHLKRIRELLRGDFKKDDLDEAHDRLTDLISDLEKEDE